METTNTEKKVIVKTDLTNEEISEALKGETKELWNVFKTLEGNIVFEREYLKVKKGIRAKFDIRLVTKGFVEERPDYGIVKLAKKQQLNVYDFWDELDRREEIMKNILRDEFDDTFDNQKETIIHGFNEENEDEE